MVKSKKNLLLVILSVLFALTLVSFFFVRPVKAETPDLYTLETASIRLDKDGANDDEDSGHLGKDGKNGIKFVGYVAKSIGLSVPNADTDSFADTDVYAGIMVAKGEYTAEQMESLPADDKLDIPAVRMDPANNTDTHRAFNAVVYGAPASEYKTKLTAVAYLYNAGEYTYASTVCTRSILEVASSSLLEDNPTPEDAELLQSFVDYANHVVKLGDTVLSADATNEITLTGGDTLPIIVEPAGVAYKASIVAGNALKIENNVISVKTVQYPVQEVLINVLGTEYTARITTVADYSEVNGKILASFDSADSIYAVYDGDPAGTVDYINKSIEWLDSATALAETGRESGMLKVTTVGSYDRISYKLPTPKKVSEFSALYVKIKAPANVEWKGDSSGGLIYGGVNGVLKAFGFDYFRSYLPGNGEWNEFFINYYDLIRTFGYTLDTEIKTIDIYLTGASEKVYYIDEIGIVADTSDTMLVDFSYGTNAMVRGFLASSQWLNGETPNIKLETVHPGDADYPTFGTGNSLLKVSQWVHGAELELFPSQLIKSSEIASVTFNLYVPWCSEHGGNITTQLKLGMAPGDAYKWNYVTGVNSGPGIAWNKWKATTYTLDLTDGAYVDSNGASVTPTKTSEYLTNLYLFIKHWGSDGNYIDDSTWYLDSITFTKKSA